MDDHAASLTHRFYHCLILGTLKRPGYAGVSDKFEHFVVNMNVDGGFFRKVIPCLKSYFSTATLAMRYENVNIAAFCIVALLLLWMTPHHAHLVAVFIVSLCDPTFVGAEY